MSNKVKVPGGAFYLGDGLTVDPVTRTVSAGGGGGGEVTTLHISVTALNKETMEATFTADKTPTEMQQASVNGPIWCVVTFAVGVIPGGALSLGIPPAWNDINTVAFGSRTFPVHNQYGENDVVLAVSGIPGDGWIIDLAAFEQNICSGVTLTNSATSAMTVYITTIGEGTYR